MRILFIDIDTLRPDHMGCYGYSRNTTPNMDRVCAEGIRFDEYYCSDAPCLPSRASLVSGMFGIRNGAVGHGGTAADRRLHGPARDFTDIVDDNCFHSIFRRAGMHTASVSTFPERHSSWWFNAGFNECYNVGGRGGESGEEAPCRSRSTGCAATRARQLVPARTFLGSAHAVPRAGEFRATRLKTSR